MRRSAPMISTIGVVRDRKYRQDTADSAVKKRFTPYRREASSTAR